MDRENTQERQKESLTELTEAFRSWRSQRAPGSKIPEELWDQVCKLEPEYGFGTVAHACRLNYAQFRRRLGLPVSVRKPKQTTRSELPSGAKFLEVGNLGSVAGGECCIEVDVPQRKMTIRLTGSSGDRAGAIISGLWDLLR